MDSNSFHDVVTLFGRIHADAAEGKTAALATLMRAPLLFGVAVVDAGSLAPLTGYPVVDDDSEVRRQDLLRDLERVGAHLQSRPSVYRRNHGGLTLAFAARTDDDVAFEPEPSIDPDLRYALVTLDGPTAAFVVALGNIHGGVTAVLRCPAGEAVTTSVSPALAELAASIVASCVSGGGPQDMV